MHVHVLKHIGRWLAALTIALVATALPALAQTPGKQPNIVVIMGDDIASGTSAPTTAA